MKIEEVRDMVQYLADPRWHQRTAEMRALTLRLLDEHEAVRVLEPKSDLHPKTAQAHAAVERALEEM